MRYCIKHDDLQCLFEKELHFITDSEILKSFKKGMTLQEMYEQIVNKSGEHYEATEIAIKKFNSKTENVEISIALELSKLYSFGARPDQIGVCFEMKNKFNGKIDVLSDLTHNIESATHIDCALLFDMKEWRFQIKRYPSKFKDYSENGIKRFLHDVIHGKYGKKEMSETNLIILLQPSLDASFRDINFKLIHKYLLSVAEQISFVEISFIFNANNTNLVLKRIYPDFISTNIPIIFKSLEYQALQKPR